MGKQQGGKIVGKAANGEGSVYQRKDGRWVAALVAENPTTGERERFYFYGKTQAEAKKKRKEAVTRAEAGLPVRDSAATVGAWLEQWRTTTLEASDRKASTKSNYTTMSEHHLEPAPFGVIPLDKLRASDIDRLVIALRNDKLSEATVQRIFNVLRMALNDAVRDGLLARNPMDGMKQPHVRRMEAVFLSPEQTRAILAAAEGGRYHAIIATIAAMGLRKGEALALKWQDIDLTAGTLRVRGTLARVNGELVVTEPKTAKSRRTLSLSPGVVSLLKAHRKTQIADQLRAGNLWTDTGHVFTTEFGGPLEPSNVLRAVKNAAKAAKVQNVTVHTLRHAAATAWLEGGVNLKAVSELLGHADIRITADVYGHVSEDVARAAMVTLSDVLGLHSEPVAVSVAVKASEMK